MTLRAWRLALGGIGILLGTYGALRLLTEVSLVDVVVLAGWMGAAVALHDGVLSPLVLLVGAALTHLPPRARRFVQGALVVAGSLAVIGVVLIVRRDSQPRAKALLLRDYQANLAILLGIVVVASALAYFVQVGRDRRAGGRGRGRIDSDA